MAKSTNVRTDLYKKEGDLQERNNDTGISLQSFPGKIFIKLIQNRMKQYTKKGIWKRAKAVPGQEETQIRPINSSRCDRFLKKNRTQPKSLHQLRGLQATIRNHNLWHDGMWIVMKNARIPQQLVQGIYRKSSSAIKVDKKNYRNAFIEKLEYDYEVFYPHTSLT